MSTPSDPNAQQPAPSTFAPAATRLVPEPNPVPLGVSSQAIVPPYDAGLNRIITVALTDLGQRLGISASAVEVVEVRSAVWPNPGLGCPQPGMAYKQVPVDGLFIQLRVSGQRYNYHSGNGREPFLCTQAAEQNPPPGGDLSK